MEKYDYYKAVQDDIRTYLDENDIVVTTNNRDEIEQQLNDDLFVNDNVTGNASGSYTFSTWKAEENLCHNMDLLFEALEEFGTPLDNIKSAESCDVTIRCYLLGECISKVLDEVEVEDDEEEDDD